MLKGIGAWGLGVVFSLSLTAGLSAKESPALPPQEAQKVLTTWLNRAAKIESLAAELEQMRELPVLKTKLRRKGKIWFSQNGQFRWQMGEPPSLLVTKEASGSIVVLEPKKASAQRWTQDALLAQEKQGGGHGFAMMDAMRKPNAADFEKQFLVNSITPNGEGKYVLDLSLRDAQAANFIRQIELEIDPEQGTLHRMTMVMQDKARLHTIITAQTLNPKISDSTFQVDLTGYKVEDHR